MRKPGVLISSSLLLLAGGSYLRAQVATPAPEAAPAVPVIAPEFPKRPAELPPSPPRVSCRDGQLTIAAENSTLRSVLDSVRNCIGVQIEIPEGSAAERTYVQLGPGPVREVLQSLLSDTEFNYVIERSDADPEKVHSILLMARSKDDKDAPAAGDMTLTPARRAWLELRRRQRPTQTASDDSPAVEASAPAATEAEAPAQAEASSAMPAEKAAASGEGAGQDGAKKTAAANEAGANEGTPAVNAGASTNAGETANAGAKAGAEVSTEAAPVANPPAAAGSEAPSGATREMQDKISNMQQLFEQRRQMIQSQAPAQNPQ